MSKVQETNTKCISDGVTYKSKKATKHIACQILMKSFCPCFAQAYPIIKAKKAATKHQAGEELVFCLKLIVLNLQKLLSKALLGFFVDELRFIMCLSAIILQSVYIHIKRDVFNPVCFWF